MYRVPILLGKCRVMKYLVNVHLPHGEVRSDLFFNSIDEVDQYVEELRTASVPFKTVVVYDNETREAVKMYKSEQ